MAKYSKQYKSNRKLKTGKKVLDGLDKTQDPGLKQQGFDGNQIITNDINDTENTNQNNFDNYAGAATAAGVYGANYYNTYQDPNATTSDKAQAGRQGVAATASAINPVVGGIIGGVDAIATPIKTNLEKTDSQGNLTNQKGAQAGAIVGNILSPSTLATTISEGKWDLTGKKYANSLEADAKAKIAEADAPRLAAIEAEKNKYHTFEQGGNLTRYENGGKHSESPYGGIPIGENSLVEEGETRGIPNTNTKDYIYSDTLKVPGKKITFAKASKLIENKYSKRLGDKLSEESKNRDMDNLMNSQEALREKMLSNTYKKAYGTHIMPDGSVMNNNEMKQGGHLNFKSNAAYKAWLAYGHASGEFEKTPGNQDISIQGKNKKVEHANGGPILNTNVIPPIQDNTYAAPKKVAKQSYPFYQEQDGKYYKGNFNLTPDQIKSFKQDTTKLPYNTEVTADEYNKNLNTINMLSPYRTKEYIQNTTIPTFKYGGKMKYVNGGRINPLTGEWEVISDDGRPVTTQENYNNSFGADNSNLVTSTNDLYKTAVFGNNAVNRNDGTNQLELTANTARDFSGYTPNNGIAPRINPQLQVPSTTPQLQSSVQEVPTYKSAMPKEDKVPRTNNFNTNSLYNAGNFLGGAYDIYRGLKGGDEVNYERVDPELVDYSQSREMSRRDIKENFKNTQKELRNVNNPAAYLNLLTQSAGQRDKTLADVTAKSFEAEKNANVGTRNQSKYFNAQTQRAELDARQAEKDVSKNTLSTGLYNTGMAISQMGSDKNMTAQDKLAIEAIGQKYPNWKYDSKTNKWKFKNETKTTAELINQ